MREHLAGQFDDFLWAVETENRRAVPADHGGIDPIDLVETGCSEKISRSWDFAIVVTDAELVARERPFTVGIPSSALETVVLTTARFPAEDEATGLRIAALAQYLFGHVLGLVPHEPGAMRQQASSGVTSLEEFDEADRALVNRRLAEVADLRLEERRHRLNRDLFGLSAFFANPRGVLTYVVGYQPWLQPFRLGGLTAAAFVTTLLFFLGAESWEMGVGMAPAVSVGAARLAIAGATLFLYRGQNLTELTRRRVLSEQLARSRVVLLLCITIGMLTLWLLLFVASFRDHRVDSLAGGRALAWWQSQRHCQTEVFDVHRHHRNPRRRPGWQS